MIQAHDTPKRPPLALGAPDVPFSAVLDTASCRSRAPMRKAAAIMLLALTGCGTIADLADGQARAFGGVRTDWDYVAEGGPCCRTAALAPCFFFDLPLCAAADVALLPFTIPAEIFAPKPVKLKR